MFCGVYYGDGMHKNWPWSCHNVKWQSIMSAPWLFDGLTTQFWHFSLGLGEVGRKKGQWIEISLVYVGTFQKAWQASMSSNLTFFSLYLSSLSSNQVNQWNAKWLEIERSTIMKYPLIFMALINYKRANPVKWFNFPEFFFLPVLMCFHIRDSFMLVISYVMNNEADHFWLTVENSSTIYIEWVSVIRVSAFEWIRKMKNANLMLRVM